MRSIENLIAAYECGIDYGLILAEQERDSEDVFDAAGCAAYSSKMCAPSVSAPRRRPRSAAWRESKRKSMERFLALLVETDGRDDDNA